MNMKSLTLGASLLAMTAMPLVAQAADEQQTLIQRASITISDLRRDKEFGTAKDLMHRASAILIVPRLFKGGFFVGGEGGEGVLLTRLPSGNWSAPAFYGIGSVSFGLQIGVEQSEMILFVMNPKALDALMADQFKVGANAAIAVATLGSSVEGATTAAAGADIVTWASSTGAYAGISLNGSIIKPSLEDNRAYYGRALTTHDIVTGQAVTAPGAAALQSELAALR